MSDFGSGLERRRGSVGWSLAAMALLAAVAITTGAQVAEAQPKGRDKGKQPPPAEAPSDDVRKEAAKSMFRVALDAFKAGQYREALDKLKQVYELDPNPIILYNIGRSYEELGQLAEAADFFQRAVADATLPEKLQAEIGRRLPVVLPVLKAREARLISSRSIGSGVVAATDKARSEALARAKGPDVIVKPKDEPNLVEDPLFWSGIGATALGGGLLVGAALIDNGLADPIDELMNPETRRNVARTEALQSQIDRDQLLATSFYIGGGVLAVAGGVLLYLAVDGLEAPPAVEEAPSQTLFFAPILTDQAAGMTVGGAF